MESEEIDRNVARIADKLMNDLLAEKVQLIASGVPDADAILVVTAASGRLAASAMASVVLCAKPGRSERVQRTLAGAFLSDFGTRIKSQQRVRGLH